MELVREFGDPHVLFLAEDHVVLKLHTAWPRDVAVPEGLSLADDNRRLLIANQRSLVSAAKSGFPREARILKALFCGCASFDSADRYASAASKLLRDTHEICIVHNRDKVYKLVRMFPNVRALALLHDCCEHGLEFDEPLTDPSVPLVERSQLRQLVGSAGCIYDGYLIMTRATTLALLHTCPDVRRIDSQWVAHCIMGPHSVATSKRLPKAKDFSHLWVFSLDEKSSRCLPMATDVALAAKKFPSVEMLQVSVGTLKALADLSAFGNLRRLKLGLYPFFGFTDVDPVLKQLLTRWPRLEELALKNCGGVRLSTIAKLCPMIRVLKLRGGVGSIEDIPVDAHAFPNLECVEISMKLLRRTSYPFLSAIRDTLRTASFGDDEMCFEFLQFCIHYGRHLPFPRLEHLTLDTKLSLRKLELEPGKLHDALKALPALRHLETDSYDLRLFFENYCVPRGRLSLSWIGCVYCDAHNPELARRYKEMLATVANDSVQAK
ncbi:hypothetical protein HPB49_021201 [Dermacentor silvarum]|uniref:Uncharacterized protein n=1 Tax=Dermacentor silvarum TaxID=543639 RepID=A0ACB8C5H5_DERSI|nr:uncharacterized protein LOC119464113 isoform X1 [Dermacentor silvarum]XP_049512432.1 uncharacterized protein LOC119464113 isoform X1 [Dermacentor silvarum]KAH7934081.1 hypothetical protein HPB49_021201 [Dermacentor silvarum]